MMHHGVTKLGGHVQVLPHHLSLPAGAGALTVLNMTKIRVVLWHKNNISRSIGVELWWIIHLLVGILTRTKIGWGRNHHLWVEIASFFTRSIGHIGQFLWIFYRIIIATHNYGHGMAKANKNFFCSRGKLGVYKEGDSIIKGRL